jgi:EAL domain-containing protein (putative c-di-GMP-specific phosphodiesterase class I)/AmiR/NasT family two-component response regulator
MTPSCSTQSKILVVEDEALAAENIARHLRKQGYEISAIVASGEEAIAKAYDLCPDLILMDISLQGDIDGILATHQITSQLNVPVVYMTAYADDKTLERAKSTNPYGYLVKPFKPHDLKVSIEIALQKYRVELLKEQYYAAQLEDSQWRQREQMSQVERAIAVDLPQALKRGEFNLVYQPRINLRSRHVASAEALIRWQHPQLGAISPAQFIPIAEATGLIEPIGAWVLKTACQQLQDWHRLGWRDLRVSVNLSGCQLHQPHLCTQFTQIFQDTQLDPKFVELELTENVLIKDIDQAVLNLHALKSLGISIAIDDFGTGYSSMGLLNAFPFDSLKLDRCFIRDIDRNPKNVVIAGSVIVLAHHLDITVVAEGVETEAELDYLVQLDCDEVQGFLLSRPLSPPQFLTTLGEKY